MYEFVNQREEAMQDEIGAEFGDPRRCARHGTVISSPDGMFDGLCGHCESEMDDARLEYNEKHGIDDSPPMTAEECAYWDSFPSPPTVDKPLARSADDDLPF